MVEWFGCQEQQGLCLDFDSVYVSQYLFVFWANILALCIFNSLFMEIKLVLRVVNLLVTETCLKCTECLGFT